MLDCYVCAFPLMRTSASVSAHHGGVFQNLTAKLRMGGEAFRLRGKKIIVLFKEMNPVPPPLAVRLRIRCKDIRKRVSPTPSHALLPSGCVLNAINLPRICTRGAVQGVHGVACAGCRLTVH